MRWIRSLFALMLMSTAYADTVTMQDGRVFEGTFLVARQISVFPLN